MKNVLLEAIEKPEKHPLVFICVITLALGVAVNGLSDLIFGLVGEQVTHLFGISKSTWQISIVLLLIISILLGISNVWSRVRKLLRRGTAVETVRVFELDQTFPGLIVVMSLEMESPAKLAIEHHWNQGNGDLAHCWMICTEKSLPVAEKLVNYFVDQGIPRRFFHYGKGYELVDVEQPEKTLSLFLEPQYENDPTYIRRIVDSVYQDGEERHRLMESEIIADYTGGTKSATAGIVLACTKPGRRLQYLMSDYVNNQPENSRVMEVRISYHLEALPLG